MSNQHLFTSFSFNFRSPLILLDKSRLDNRI